MSEQRASRLHRLLTALALCTVLAACERTPADYEQLRAENQRLKAQIEQLTGPTETSSKPGAEAPRVVELSMKDLWSQRFEETKLRAKMNLDQKLLRVTGNINTVGDRTISLYENTSKFGRVTMQVQLNDSYADKVREGGLSSLVKGVPVAVQGKLVFDTMWLTDAVFVDSKSGKQLTSTELAELNSDRIPGNSGDAAKTEPSVSKTGLGAAGSTQK